MCWTASLQSAPTAEECLAEPPHDAPQCASGRGQLIEVLPQHGFKGLPRFIQGHCETPNTLRSREANAEGLLNIRKAAERLGMGQSTLRR